MDRLPQLNIRIEAWHSPITLRAYIAQAFADAAHEVESHKTTLFQQIAHCGEQ